MATDPFRTKNTTATPMNVFKPEPTASQLSELLLYHSVLGRGYVSPFPLTKGLVFSSALPPKSLIELSAAESSFSKWHQDSIEPMRKMVAQFESPDDSYNPLGHVTGANKNNPELKKLKEKISKRSSVTWKEKQVLDSTIVELLKTHYYGAMTYLDASGARLASSLSYAPRLALDLGWITMTEGTTDEAFIRANANGGAAIHSLAGLKSVFNHFCKCQPSHVDKLRDKIRNTVGGQVGLDHSVLIGGRPEGHSGVNADLLFSLLKRVYSLGSKEEDDRVRVELVGEGWDEFLAGGLPEVINEPTPANWQWKMIENTPASPETAILFGARAAMVAAFLEQASMNPGGDLKLVELDGRYLALAKEYASIIFRSASGYDSMERRIKSLPSARESYLSPMRMAVAKRSIEEAISDSELGRVSRNQIHREVKGATLAALDELVRLGSIVELRGAEECQMGQVRRAYCLPGMGVKADEQDARDEYEEACELHESGCGTSDADALEMVAGLRSRAEAIFNEHFLPVVPLSMMTSTERRALPRLLEMYPESLLMRGAGTAIPEPPDLLSDDDSPLDKEAPNLWVRYRKDGSDFCEWRKVASLDLAGAWGKEVVSAPVVPV